MTTLSIDVSPSAPRNIRLTSATDAGTVGDGIASVASLILEGSSEAGSTIKVYEGAALIGTGVANSFGSWSTPLCPVTAGGTYLLAVTATDKAGSISPTSAFTPDRSNDPITTFSEQELAGSRSLSFPSAVPRELQVVVGGINGYDALADQSNFTVGISTGRLGLYQHWAGVVLEGDVNSGLNGRIATAWKNAPPGEIENNLWSTEFFKLAASASTSDGLGFSYYRNWLSNGLSASMQNVNTMSPFGSTSADLATALTEFEQLTDVSKSVGIITTAPIYSPNGVEDLLAIQSGKSWTSDTFSFVRQMALYGGALTIDAPPSYFFAMGVTYQEFCESQIRWAEANHLRTTVIVSPYDSGPNFLVDAERYQQILAAANALPTQWAVENYFATSNSPDGIPGYGAYPNPIGSEGEANTVAQVATWYAQSAAVVAYSPTGAIWVQNPTGAIIAADVVGNDGKIVRVTASGLAKNYYYNDKGALVWAATAPTGLTLALAGGIGVLGNGKVTNMTLPVVTGSAEANSTINIYDGSALVGTGTTTTAGVFAIPVSAPLTDGQHALMATASDAAGNVSPTSAGLNLSIDTSGGKVIADPLFDAALYLKQNPDVAAAGVDPYQHYMTQGWKEGRNPSALFNTNYYLNQNPDVKAAGVNPLTHFETYGWLEGRDPSVGFSVSSYLTANGDVKAAGVDPLVHYLQNGRLEGRTAFAAVPHATGQANPLVDANYTYAHNPAVAAEGLDATAWFNSVGWTQEANPNALFDTNYYLTQNSDVRSAGVNPLDHFEAVGWKEGRQPSLVFDDGKYLAAYKDVKAAGIEPLLHYVQFGHSEGRIAFLVGGSAALDPLVNAGYFDAQLGVTTPAGGLAGALQAAYAYDHGGWQAGLKPDAFFDTAYYLSHNPDVAAAHIDPLVHYEVHGWLEGRDPSAAFSTNKYLAAYGDVKAAGIDPLLHYIQNGLSEGRSAFTS